MNDDILNEARTRAASAYLRRAGARALPHGFDPSIIVDIILRLLEICKKPASQLQATCREPGWTSRSVAESVTRSMLRRRYGLFAYDRMNGDAIVAAILDVGAAAELEQIDALGACCCG